jgi:HD-GYP domain-containing protein (c-di-GMP phosphodiesterase class II)
LKKGDIPIHARIFAFADTLDAITNDRPYRKAQSFQFAREEIVRNVGSQFDPEIAEVFLSIPIDTWISIRREVLLNSSNRIQLWFKPKLEVLKSES